MPASSEVEALRRRVDELERMLAELSARLPVSEAPKKRIHRAAKAGQREDEEGA